MKLSKADGVRIFILLTVLAAEAILVDRLHKHPNDNQELVALSAASIGFLILVAEFLWINWLSRREIFGRTLLASLFGFAALADFLKGQRLPAAAFGGLFVFGAVLVLRKLAHQVGSPDPCDDFKSR